MLILAAAGGVGLLLIQMVKARGGRVIAVTSTEEKAELARGAGADETIGYEGFSETARELTGGKGVAVVYDSVGATTFEDGIDALRPRGMMVLYGHVGRAGARLRPAAAAGALALHHAPGAAALHGHARRTAGSARATCSTGSRTARSTCGSASATRSRTRAARTRTSRRAGRPASSC